MVQFLKCFRWKFLWLRINKGTCFNIGWARSLKSQQMAPLKRAILSQWQVRPESTLLFELGFLLLQCFKLPFLRLSLHNSMHLVQLAVKRRSRCFSPIKPSLFLNRFILVLLFNLWIMLIRVLSNWFLGTFLALLVYLLLRGDWSLGFTQVT